MNKYRKLNENFGYANAENCQRNGFFGEAVDELGVARDDDDDSDEEAGEHGEYAALFLDNNYNNSISNNNNNKHKRHKKTRNKNNFDDVSNKRKQQALMNNEGRLNGGFHQQQQQQISSNNNNNFSNQQQNFTNNNNRNGFNTSTVTTNSSSNIISAATNGNLTNQTALDAAEESIMEVPLLLLGHSNNNADNYDADNDDDDDNDDVNDCNNFDDEPVLHQISNYKGCRCNQPGFAVNLKTKSAQEAKCKILLAIALCCIFMIIEFLGGYFAGSLAIMTDAAHLASDCISFIIGLVAIWLGTRRPDGRMSFGYKRMEVMGAVVSILGIWMLTATLVMMAIERIYSNDFDLDANTMMTISGIGILINIAMVFILHGSAFMPGGHGHSHAHAHGHGHSHSHVHVPVYSDNQLTLDMPETDLALCENHSTIGNGNLKKRQHPLSTTTNPDREKNLNLRAAMIHVIGDLVQSIGVFLAAVLIKFFPSAKFADPLCTILFSFIVIMTTTRLFRESVTILLDAVPKGVSIKELELDLRHLDGVRALHHLNVWQHTSNYNVMMVHLVIDLLSDSNTVLDKATKLAQSSKYDIKHCTIQIERLAS